jgi:hypothetical protein
MWYVFPVLVYCTKNNLATLLGTRPFFMLSSVEKMENKKRFNETQFNETHFAETNFGLRLPDVLFSYQKSHFG